MYRGRLIRPLVATIAPLDTAAIDTAGNYDDVFREVKKTDTDSDGIGETQRVEGTPYTLQVQVETSLQENQRMAGTGDLPDSSIALVAHMKELEEKGMVAADGRVSLKKRDRLVKIADELGNDVISFDRVPVYVTHVKRIDGWINSRSNLLWALFEERPQGRV